MKKAARALHAGQRAKQLANAALRRAAKANDRLDGLAVQSATAGGTVTTGDEDDYVALGGPEVTVTVPDSGLIEVWSTVTFGDPSDGLVALYEDGQRIPNDDSLGICGSGTLGDVLSLRLPRRGQPGDALDTGSAAHLRRLRHPRGGAGAGHVRAPARHPYLRAALRRLRLRRSGRLVSATGRCGWPPGRSLG